MAFPDDSKEGQGLFLAAAHLIEVAGPRSRSPK
jgi:hypothetical protein